MSPPQKDESDKDSEDRVSLKIPEKEPEKLPSQQISEKEKVDEDD
jgi:hypothetical protein